MKVQIEAGDLACEQNNVYAGSKSIFPRDLHADSSEIDKTRSLQNQFISSSLVLHWISSSLVYFQAIINLSVFYYYFN